MKQSPHKPRSNTLRQESIPSNFTSLENLTSRDGGVKEYDLRITNHEGYERQVYKLKITIDNDIILIDTYDNEMSLVSLDSSSIYEIADLLLSIIDEQ